MKPQPDAATGAFRRPIFSAASIRRPLQRILILGLLFIPAFRPVSDAYIEHATPLTENHLQFIIQRLDQSIRDDQWTARHPAVSHVAGIFLGKRYPGLYPSSIHVGHFFLGPAMAAPACDWLRRFFRLTDTNMFATSIVTHSLLEAQQLGAIRLPPDQVARSVRRLLHYRDRNLPDGVPAYGFWQQKKTGLGWQLHPDNIVTIVAYGAHIFPIATRLLHYFGLDITRVRILGSPDLQVGYLQGDGRGFLNRFNMPADLDDTGLALSVGAAIQNCSPDFPQSRAEWCAANQDLEQLLALLARYAYQPRSTDRAVNLIDPRTYSWIREYLPTTDSANPAFMTTWLQSPYEGVQFGDRGTKIPLNMNNVEPSVCANAMLGLNAELLVPPRREHPPQPSAEFIRCYRDTGRLLCWVVERDLLAQTPDIVLLYYPNALNYYRFLAANLRLLDDGAARAPLPWSFMAEWRQQLGPVLRGPGTRQLLARMEHETFWPGSSDMLDDRLYSTALALNALLDIWTGAHLARPGGRAWRADTPSEVKSAVQRGMGWLCHQLRSGSPSWDNACFSGSIKGIDTVPFLFPMNVAEKYDDLRIHGVRGVMPAEEYSRQWARCQAASEARLGERNSVYTYWSSPTVTKALCLLACAKYRTMLPDPPPAS